MTLPRELAWIYGNGLAECWRRGELLDGFRVEALPHPKSSVLLGSWSTDPLPAGGETWLPVVALHLGWHHPDREGTSLPVCFEVDRQLMEPASGGSAAAAADLAVALRAWPAGEKALFVPDSWLFQVGRQAGRWVAVAAVRLGAVEPKEMAAVVEMAARLASQGVPDEDIARWVAGLKPETLPAVAGLHVLGS